MSHPKHITLGGRCFPATVVRFASGSLSVGEATTLVPCGQPFMLFTGYHETAGRGGPGAGYHLHPL